MNGKELPETPSHLLDLSVLGALVPNILRQLVVHVLGQDHVLEDQDGRLVAAQLLHDLQPLRRVDADVLLALRRRKGA